MVKNEGSIKYPRIRRALLWLKDLKEGRIGHYCNHTKVPALTYEQWPQITSFKSDIKWRSELGEANENRIHNMALCSDWLTGINIGPGQCFSLMKVIGDPTVQKGFKAGPMLIRGQLYQVAGGGICQVSTTLFNAALRAGMTIEVKHNHTWDLWGEERFIGLGKDATYAYGRKDLIVRNPYNHALVLTMTTDAKNLTLGVTIYSEEPMTIESDIKTDIIEALTDEDRRIKSRGWRVKTTCHCRINEMKKQTYSKEEIYQPLYHREVTHEH